MAPLGPLFCVLAVMHETLDAAGRRRERPTRALHRSGPLAAVLLAALAILFATAVAASAAWTPQFDLSAPSGGEHAQVAVDPAGNAVVAWEGDGGATVVVRARKIDAGGALGPIQDVSDPTVFGNHPQVAMDAAGNVTVVWTESVAGDATVRARRITADGVLEDVQDVSGAGEEAREPQLSVDAAGNVTVIWFRPNGGFSYTIRARRIDSAGGLSSVVDLTDDQASPVGYRLAAGPGDAYAVWTRAGVVQGRRIGPDAELGPVVDLSDGAGGADRPDVAVDRSGIPTVAWQVADGRVQFRQELAGGGLGPITDLAGPEAFLPRVAVDLAGAATVVWDRYDGSNQRAELRRIAPGGALGETKDLWAGGSDEPPRVAIDERGDATVVWLNFDDAGEPVIRSRSVTAGGVVAPAVDLSPEGEVELQHPAVATDPGGNAIAVWTRYADPDNVIAGSRFQVPPTAPARPPVSVLPAPGPAPGPAPAGAPSCAGVALGKLRADTAGHPRSRSRRTKGVGAKLTLSRTARLHIRAATLSYRLRGKARTAKLRTRRLTTGRRARLRLRLPGDLATRLDVGARVTLRLRLRAAPTDAGCAFGNDRLFKIRTRVIWVSRRAAI